MTNGRKRFFLKKRTKKPLTLWAERPRPRRSQNDRKFFAAFFKKQASPPLAFASRRLPGQLPSFQKSTSFFHAHGRRWRLPAGRGRSMA
jgi:hypothetical protein